MEHSSLPQDSKKCKRRLSRGSIHKNGRPTGDDPLFVYDFCLCQPPLSVQPARSLGADFVFLGQQPACTFLFFGNFVPWLDTFAFYRYSIERPIYFAFGSVVLHCPRSSLLLRKEQSFEIMSSLQRLTAANFFSWTTFWCIRQAHRGNHGRVFALWWLLV